tara:strand:+ start:637 stop:1050 length:414 start_codon:yes stop_codon:yes gene_type:complete
MSGKLIIDLLTAAKHKILEKKIIRDEPSEITTTLKRVLSNTSTQVVITTGGTGISKRDQTYDVIRKLLEKPIDGFGELFRALSYQEIGSSAMLTRACAGTALGKILISIPGSENAVRLAMEKLILPELGHLVREVSR